MKHEIVEMNDVQIIGMSKEIAFCHPEECARFWTEYVDRIVRPVILEGLAPDEFQQAALENGVGEYGLCTCSIPHHNCGKCGVENFTPCNTKTFTYVIGGIYKGGRIPEGMSLYPIRNGQWLKVHFEGGLKAFQEQFARLQQEWLPAHKEFVWAKDASTMEWYHGKDPQSPHYECGIMMPIEG